MALSSCHGGANDGAGDIADAERAYAGGDYGRAQMIADSLATDHAMERMSVRGLCRLSLLLVHLSDNAADISSNTALAVRALDMAAQRDSDSTAVFIGNMPIDDRAKMALVSAIARAYHADTDSLLGGDLDFDEYAGENASIHGEE